jgi:hypothetical protein
MGPFSSTVRKSWHQIEPCWMGRRWRIWTLHISVTTRWRAGSDAQASELPNHAARRQCSDRLEPGRSVKRSEVHHRPESANVNPHGWQFTAHLENRLISRQPDARPDRNLSLLNPGLAVPVLISQMPDDHTSFQARPEQAEV